MLRIHFIQHWFNLNDLACEEALYDSASLRHFVGIDLGQEPVPDATTMLKFRRLLNDNQLGQALFAQVGRELQARGIKVNTGTIVDASIIGAPSSTKNADKARDPEMHQTRKGQQWYFGMKLHIGVDSQTGLTHSAVVTAANVHDKHPLPELLHDNERRVYGDSAYASQKELIATKAPRAKDFTNERTHHAGEVDEVARSKNRNKHAFAPGWSVSLRWSSGCGVHRGALPWAAEERHACIYRLGAVQHLPQPRALAGAGAPVRVEAGPKARQTAQPGGERGPKSINSSATPDAPSPDSTCSALP